MTPTRPWAEGRYRVVVDAELEDVSGNTPGAPFDARAGAIGKADLPMILAFRIRR